jgi:hypothetical protein
MFVRNLVLCLSLAGCASKAPPSKPEPAPAAPAPAPEPSAAPTTPAVPPAPVTPPAPTTMTPPVKWEQIGHRPGQPDVVMGAVVWRGGEDFEVEVMGSMKYLLQQELSTAIKEKPDDPGAAIADVLKKMTEMTGSPPMMEWVRAKAK